MIDDATSRMLARFVEHDSTEENMRLLASYLEQNGRPLSFYTDKATLFANTPKTERGELAGKDRVELADAGYGTDRQFREAIRTLGLPYRSSLSVSRHLREMR